MFQQQQEQQQEMLRRQHEHNCDLEDKREKARARERAEDLERKEHDRQLDRERAAEHDHLLIENSAGLQQLRRDMANSPRFSRRGTPTGTPVPAVDDRPKPAPP